MIIGQPTGALILDPTGESIVEAADHGGAVFLNVHQINISRIQSDWFTVFYLEIRGSSLNTL